MTHQDGGNGSRKFSPYLLDAQSGHKVKVCYHKITISADDAALLQQQGWSFDWSLTADETVIKLTTKNSNVIQ